MNPYQNSYVITIIRRSSGKIEDQFFGLPEAKAKRTFEAITKKGNDQKYIYTMNIQVLWVTRHVYNLGDEPKWYIDSVGGCFPFLGTEPADNDFGFEMKVRTDQGKTNFIDPDHCQVTEYSPLTDGSFYPHAHRTYQLTKRYT